jgi:hypothetical protein
MATFDDLDFSRSGARPQLSKLKIENVDQAVAELGLHASPCQIPHRLTDAAITQARAFEG